MKDAFIFIIIIAIFYFYASIVELLHALYFYNTTLSITCTFIE